MSEKTVRNMVQNIENILRKNGFPANRVSLPLERLYESAHRDGINFNKVLTELENIGIGNEKTAEKIVFFKVASISPEAFSFEQFKNMDFSELSTDQLMRQATDMMSAMTPEQIEKIKQMYEGLSSEERSHLMNLAKNLQK